MGKVNKQVSALVAAGLLAVGTAYAPSAPQRSQTVQHEGISLTAYRDSVGVPTICFGSTKGVTMGMRATFAECEIRLTDDLSEAGKGVARLVQVPITQGQYDALTDFVFNLGASRLAKSTLLRKLNAGDYCGAAQEFDRWVYAKNAKTGKQEKLRGLVKRRAANREAFEKGLTC